MRFLLLAALLVLSSAVYALTPEQWLEDLHQLVDEMSSHYANLDSAVDDRRVDLPAIRKTTEERIGNAKNDAEAKEAIEWFLRQFGDGHASVSWSAATKREKTPELKSLCERWGYSRREPGGIDFAQVEGFTPLQDTDALYFPGGVLRLSDRKRLGILRIHLFSETAHPELCTQALGLLQLADDAECDGECGHRIALTAANLLSAALERRVEALQRAGATALVLDITGNGGGSDWVEPAARVLTPVPLRSPRLAFLRHPHWSKQLRERLADIEADLRGETSVKAELEEAASDLRAAIEEAERPCDRSSLWYQKKPDCSLIVATTLFSSGVLPYAKPGSLSQSLMSRGVMFHASQYTYREGVNRLPLFVLVDSGTASASELFAAMLRDNNAARLIGTSTLGAGCGHTNGGIPATLHHSGAELKLPDCIRLRADETNEVMGIIPDVLVPWRTRDSRYQRAMKTVRALDVMVK